MKLNRKRAAMMFAVAAATMGTATPAVNAAVHQRPAELEPDTKRVTCGTRTDWFRVWAGSKSTEYCYADPGSLNPGLFSPREVDTGNNAGHIWWFDGCNSHYYNKALPNDYSIFRFNAGTQYCNTMSKISLHAA